MLAMLIKGIMDFFDSDSNLHGILNVASWLAIFVSYAILATILFSKSGKYKDNTLSIIAFLFNSVFFSL